MLAIYKRELQSYFRSFIGFLFIGATLFFLGLYFSVYNIMNGYPYFSYALTSIVFLFMVSIPILSMRILAEEKRSRTDQLILTAPVPVGGIVLGKFLALVTIFAIPVVIGAVYPLIMSRFGTVPMGEAYVALLGYFLYGMTAIAIGVFISSVTESQVIAAVLGFAVLFLGYMMNSIIGIISITGNLFTLLLSSFDLYTPYANLCDGTLNLASVTYYLSITALFLFLTVQSIQKRRYSVSVKNLSMGAYSTGMIAVAVVIVVVVNIVLAEMPSTWTNIDISNERLYSLTDQTKEFVGNMEEDITIYVLTSEANQDTLLGQTLQRYDDLSGHITVSYVDPTVNPLFYSNYSSTTVASNSLIVESGRRSKVIDYNDIYEKSATFDYNTYSYVNEITGFDGEGQITAALSYVLSDDVKKLYISTGHSEYELSSGFLAALEKANVEYENIDLMEYDAVPENASCLIINAPEKDFSTDDRTKVEAYLNGGGNVIYVAGFTSLETPNLDALLAGVGLSVAEGLVVDPNTENYYSNPYYLLPTLSDTFYTSGLFSNNYYVFSPFSQGLVIADRDAAGLTYTDILTTSDSAFSKQSLESQENFEKEEGDIDGPFSLGVEVMKAVDENTAGTMVVFGSSEIFTANADQYVRGANLTLFSNTVSAFVNNEVNVSVPAKSYEVSSLSLNRKDIVIISLITTILMPLASLVTGFVIWLRRRAR